MLAGGLFVRPALSGRFLTGLFATSFAMADWRWPRLWQTVLTGTRRLGERPAQPTPNNGGPILTLRMNPDQQGVGPVLNPAQLGVDPEGVRAKVKAGLANPETLRDPKVKAEYDAALRALEGMVKGK